MNRKDNPPYILFLKITNFVWGRPQCFAKIRRVMNWTFFCVFSPSTELGLLYYTEKIQHVLNNHIKLLMEKSVYKFTVLYRYT